MNILLLGYGKMGKAIEQIAESRGHTIIGKIDQYNISDLSKFNSDNTDVAIEFSQPDAAVDNIKYCLENAIPVLSGTTGWLEHKPTIESVCQEHGGTFFYASNYSIGVNLFFKLNQQLAKMMSAFPEYDIEMKETHHIHKKDEPSGTAITLAEGIFSRHEGKNKWELNKASTSTDLAIHSEREGEVPGTHKVTYNSAIDSIDIIHTAHSREGFAKGAVLVAEWLPGKKGLIGMTDFLNF